MSPIGTFRYEEFTPVQQKIFRRSDNQFIGYFLLQPTDSMWVFVPEQVRLSMWDVRRLFNRLERMNGK